MHFVFNSDNLRRAEPLLGLLASPCPRSGGGTTVHIVQLTPAAPVLPATSVSQAMSFSYRGSDLHLCELVWPAQGLLHGGRAQMNVSNRRSNPGESPQAK